MKNTVLAPILITAIYAAPAFADDYLAREARFNAELQRNQDRVAAMQSQQRRENAARSQTYNSPNVNYGNQPVTQTQYPGALDPQRKLPAWSYNP